MQIGVQLLVLNEKVSKEDGGKMENSSVYKSLVENLLYLTETEANLMFSARLLSRFMTSPSSIYMGIAKRVLGYLQGTKVQGIGILKLVL